MTPLKKIVVGLWTLLLFLVITNGLPLAAFARTFTDREQVKLVLVNDSVHNLISEALLNNGLGEQNPTEEMTQASPDNAALKQIIEKYLTKDTYSRGVNDIINATFDWLEGKQPQPTFNIGFASNQAEFQGFIAKVFKDRFNTLPACTTPVDVTVYNPLEASCRPPGYSELQVEQFINDQANTPELTEFYKNASINSDLVFGQVDAATTDQARSSFELLKVAPWVVWGLILALSMAILLTVFELRGGLKTLALGVLIPAFLVLFFTAIIKIAQLSVLGLFLDHNSMGGQAALEVAKVGLSPVLTRLLIYSGLLSLLSVVVLIALRFTGSSEEPIAPVTPASVSTTSSSARR